MQIASLYGQSTPQMLNATQHNFSDSDDDTDNIKMNSTFNDNIKKDNVTQDNVTQDNKNLEYWLGFTNCW